MAVPQWIAVVTFLLCWGLGGFLIVTAGLAGTADRNLLFLGFLLVIFPVASFSGLTAAIVKRIGGGK